MSGIITKQFIRPNPELVATCRQIPTALLSDAMNRMNSMCAAIKAIRNGVHVAGPAVTVQCMAGDNIMSHHAIYLAKKGDVLVMDGRSHVNTAIWGGIQTAAAAHQGISAVVIDGAIRDVAEAREASVAVFCRGVSPAGPHKGWGGNINQPISCGAVAVQPGDIVVGDDDGVVVVPRETAPDVVERAQVLMEKEAEWMRRLENGERFVDILDYVTKLDTLGVKYQ